MLVLCKYTVDNAIKAHYYFLRCASMHPLTSFGAHQKLLVTGLLINIVFPITYRNR